MKKLMLLIFCFLIVVPRISWTEDAKAVYQHGQDCYSNLLASEEKKEYRENWERCISYFNEVYNKYRGSDLACDALYSKGLLFEQLYGYSKNKNDLNSALREYNNVVKEFPKDNLADDALYQIGKLRLDKCGQKDKAAKAFSAIINEYPQEDMASKAKDAMNMVGLPAGEAGLEPQASSQKNYSMLLGIEHKEDGGLAQIAFFTSFLPAYKGFKLPQDKTSGKPERLVIDFDNTKISGSLKNEIEVLNPILQRIRLSTTDNKARAVLDLGGAASYEVTALENSVIVTLRGDNIKSTKGAIGNKAAVDARPVLAPKKEAVVNKYTKPAQVGWDIKTVVIDPGHGGKDPGAIGPHKTKEKDVVLAIAKQLAAQLRKKHNLKVYLTRSSDKYLTLDERVEFANKKNADLFLSIHANASEKEEAHGIETFYLNTASSKAAERLAAIENKGIGKKMDNLQTILMDMLQNINTEESKVLAGKIQKEMVFQLSKRYSKINNLNVHSALFYVLAGIKCPGILVETSFISNSREEFRLRNYSYQSRISSAVEAGIKNFMDVQKKKYGKL